MVACRSLSRLRNTQDQMRIKRQRSSARSLPRRAARRSAQCQRPRPQRADGRSRFPRQDPCRGSLSSPGKTLARVARPRHRSEPPLSPRFPTPPTTLELGLGRHLRGGMQIFVKTKNSQDQMRIGRQQPSTRFLPRKSTRPPTSVLSGTTTTPRQDPC